MKKLQKTLIATVLTLSVATVGLGGTITGSRTTSSRTGTITGSRTGTITGSRTGTITGSRAESRVGIIPTQSDNGSRFRTETYLVSNLMLILSSLAW